MAIQEEQPRMFVEVEGHARIYAIADEDLVGAFPALRVPPAAREAMRAGALVKLGCDHTNYLPHVQIADPTLSSLAGDLR